MALMEGRFFRYLHLESPIKRVSRYTNSLIPSIEKKFKRSPQFQIQPAMVILHPRFTGLQL